MRVGRTLIALIVSLALNLFLISAGATAYLLIRHAPARAVGVGLRRAVTALSPPDRRAFVAVLRVNGARVRPDNRRARALRDGAWGGLADGSETAAVIKQQLAEARAINQTSRTTVENAVVDFGLGLDPAGRNALGQALRPAAKPK
jgi:uncharacterized membrane protein